MRFLLTFTKIILWLVEFEIAITPKYAAHYGQLKMDRMYWQGQVQRYALNVFGGIHAK